MHTPHSEVSCGQINKILRGPPLPGVWRPPQMSRHRCDYQQRMNALMKELINTQDRAHLIHTMLAYLANAQGCKTF